MTLSGDTISTRADLLIKIYKNQSRGKRKIAIIEQLRDVTPFEKGATGWNIPAG
jgi:hypothetical protein